MKVILIFDEAPESCSKCDLQEFTLTRDGSFTLPYCAAGGGVDLQNFTEKRAEDCPLIILPDDDTSPLGIALANMQRIGI